MHFGYNRYMFAYQNAIRFFTLKPSSQKQIYFILTSETPKHIRKGKRQIRAMKMFG